MNTIFYEEKIFEGVDFTEKNPSGRTFTDCTFINCDFSKADLTNDDFMDCHFQLCNCSLAVLENTGIKNVRFTACKLVGIDFSRCNNFNFSPSFENCPMDYSSFFQKKMKKTLFADCSLKDTDFTETDLTGAVFKNCNLLQAAFVHAVLEKADFRTATNYALDPEMNKIKKAKFSYSGIAGLLAKYDIDIA
ncbi:MAG: pentapeptide repeat-containing protein [Chitinophagaceae bacterium]